MSVNTFVPSSVSPRSAAQAVDTQQVVRPVTLADTNTRALAIEGVDAVNPKFAYDRRLPPAANDSTGEPRIQRGYIRRSVANDARDPSSKYRLNFMFNPSVIARDFVSYLDQQALDPFNTLFNAGNLVAPPSILDFTFELFFDRQLEVARDASHPGCKVDFDYFDRVIRGVEPQGPNDLPDSGVLLVNPRNVKVVFSPQMTVEGRPYNARVIYEKFSHRMTPTRMRISITLKAQYIGPDTAAAFGLSQPAAVSQYAATVPWEQTVEVNANQSDIGDVQLSSVYTSTIYTPGSAAVAGQVGGSPSAGGSITGNGNSGLIWPLSSIRVSQEYGGANGHPGMDLLVASGPTDHAPIYASKDGVVSAAIPQSASGGYGNILHVTHDGGLETWYAHQPDGGFTVQQGQQVKQGQQIGHVDNTGHSTGPHLHFEVHLNGARQNPRNFCPPL